MLSTTRGKYILSVITILLAIAVRADGGQHLVAVGDDWSRLAESVHPGDEIILMPGVHRPGVLNDLTGTKDRPITIRSLNQEHRAVIECDRYGLRLRGAQHVVVADLILTEPRINGIEITPRPDDPITMVAGRAPADVTLRNITIKHVGPRGQRHAIYAVDVDGFAVEGCRFEGWAGSAIELVNVTNGSVVGSLFRGLPDFTQLAGVRIRGGSDNIRIAACRFDSAGVHAINFGHVGHSEETKTILPASTETATFHEATNVEVERCIFNSGVCIFAFESCKDVAIRFNTVVGPMRRVFAFYDTVDDPRYAPSTGCRFSSNLVTWEKDGLEQMTEKQPTLDPLPILTFDENLWFSVEFVADGWIQSQGGWPGEIAFKQVIRINPKLDQRFRATEPRAANFGIAGR